MSQSSWFQSTLRLPLVYAQITACVDSRIERYITTKEGLLPVCVHAVREHAQSWVATLQIPSLWALLRMMEATEVAVTTMIEAKWIVQGNGKTGVVTGHPVLD